MTKEPMSPCDCVHPERCNDPIPGVECRRAPGLSVALPSNEYSSELVKSLRMECQAAGLASAAGAVTPAFADAMGLLSKKFGAAADEIERLRWELADAKQVHEDWLSAKARYYGEKSWERPSTLIAERDRLREALGNLKHEVDSLNGRLRAGSEAAPWVCEKVSQIAGLLADNSPSETSGRIGLEQPDNDMVICPNCTSQFRAVPVNVQRAVDRLEVALRHQETGGDGG